MKHHTKKILAVLMTLLLTVSVFGVLGAAQETAQIKNIIYLIGDGMGPNHLAAYKHYKGISQLNMEKFPIAGYQNTRSFGGLQTDSAAGGTALACGIRTWINAVGVYPTDPTAIAAYPMNLRELAQEKGMKSGIVVTKASDDATPAAFSAHTSDRGNSEDINQQQLNSGIDVLMGAATGYIDKAAAEAKGFAYATTRDEMNAVNAGKLIGQYVSADVKKGLGEGDAPSLRAMAEKAVGLLENDNGFFLMIEGSTIDSFSHSNEMEGMLDAFRGFEDAVDYALNYAQQNQDTMVVITADHETGGITWDEEKQDFIFTTGGHTNADVPYFAYLPESIATPFVNGANILNTDVPKNMATTMGWGDVFPRKLYTELGEKIKDPVLDELDKLAEGAGKLTDALKEIIPQSIIDALLKLYLAIVDGIAVLIEMF